MSFQFKVPIVNLKQIKIDNKAVELVPEEFAREHEVLPFALGASGELLLAMESPNDFQLINTLSAMTRRSVRPALPLDSKLKDMLDVIYKPAEQLAQQLDQALQPITEPTPARAAPRPPAVLADVSEAPVVRAVEMIAFQAVKSRASDIHIVPTADSAKVIYRIDGVLHNVHTIPLGVHQNMVSRIKVMANLDIAERRRPQDGAFTLNFGEREVNFRVAVAETSYGEMMVIRVLDKSRIHHGLRDASPLLNSPCISCVIASPSLEGRSNPICIF